MDDLLDPVWRGPIDAAAVEALHGEAFGEECGVDPAHAGTIRL